MFLQLQLFICDKDSLMTVEAWASDCWVCACVFTRDCWNIFWAFVSWYCHDDCCFLLLRLVLYSDDCCDCAPDWRDIYWHDLSFIFDKDSLMTAEAWASDCWICVCAFDHQHDICWDSFYNWDYQLWWCLLGLRQRLLWWLLTLRL